MFVSSSSVGRYSFFLEVWLLMNDFLQIFTYVVDKYIIYRKEIAKSWCICVTFLRTCKPFFSLLAFAVYCHRGILAIMVNYGLLSLFCFYILFSVWGLVVGGVINVEAKRQHVKNGFSSFTP